MLAQKQCRLCDADWIWGVHLTSELWDRKDDCGGQVLRSLHVNEGLATSLAIVHVAFLLSLGYNVGTFLH